VQHWHLLSLSLSLQGSLSIQYSQIYPQARQQKAAHAGRTNHKSSTTTEEGTGGSRSTSGQAGPAAEGNAEADEEEDELEQSINFDTALAHTCNMFALLILNVIWYQYPVPGEVRYFVQVHTTPTPFHSNRDGIPPPFPYIDRPLPLC